jgi:hypothetical protein
MLICPADQSVSNTQFHLLLQCAGTTALRLFTETPQGHKREYVS